MQKYKKKRTIFCDGLIDLSTITNCKIKIYFELFRPEEVQLALPKNDWPNALLGQELRNTPQEGSVKKSIKQGCYIAQQFPNCLLYITSLFVF